MTNYNYYIKLYKWYLDTNNLKDDIDDITLGDIKCFCEEEITDDDKESFLEQCKFSEVTESIDCYLETHYQICVAVDNLKEGDGSVAKVFENNGSGGLWRIAERLTDEFERKYKDELWDENDYYETLDEFLLTNDIN